MVEKVLLKNHNNNMNLLQLISQEVRYTGSARYNDTVVYALPIVDDDVPSTHEETVMCSEENKW